MPEEIKMKNKNLTVPNALSVLRILIVPFFAWMFLTGHVIVATILLVLSGLTDCFDGLIARKFDQVTEIGKVLDPFADKLTQGVVAMCLAVKFPAFRMLLVIFIIKELGMLCCAFALVKRNRRLCAAQWYGKVATVMFYLSVGIIVVLDGVFKISGWVFSVTAYVFLVATAAMMIFSAVCYFRIFLRILRSNDPKDELNLTDEMRTKTPRKRQ